MNIITVLQPSNLNVVLRSYILSFLLSQRLPTLKAMVFLCHGSLVQMTIKLRYLNVELMELFDLKQKCKNRHIVVYTNSKQTIYQNISK